MTVHMLRSVGPDKATKRPMIAARCGVERPHRAADGFPEDFTAWEGDVSCPACTLADHDPRFCVLCLSGAHR